MENVFTEKSTVKYGYTTIYPSAEVLTLKLFPMWLHSGYYTVLHNHHLKALSLNKPLRFWCEYLLHQFKDSNQWDL